MNHVLPFVSVSVQPAYRTGQCVVTWKKSVPFQSHGVLVYRSLDGVSDWTLLNIDDEPVVLQEQLLDTDLPRDTQLDRVHYRLVLENMQTGEMTVGDTLAFFEGMNRRDYQAARRFLVAELQRLRTGAGIPIFLVMPARRPTTPGVDPVTVQVIDNCAYDAAGGYLSGFGQPMQTWVQLLGMTHTQQSEQTGTGISEKAETTARLPGFPQPVLGTLVVLPTSDDRYTVGETITPFAFRGLVPVAYQVTLTRLTRDDPRYRIPIPKLDARLALPSYTRSA